MPTIIIILIAGTKILFGSKGDSRLYSDSTNILT
jgi:hypothetical protein